MRTIQMTLDDNFVKAVDRVSKRLRISRSAFTRKALREALSRFNLEQMERKHHEGYELLCYSRRVFGLGNRASLG